MPAKQSLSNLIKRAIRFLPDLSFPNIQINFYPRGWRPSRKKHPTGVIRRPPALFLDTSAVIDGRIADIVKTGFLDGTLVVTTFVLDELQTVADSKNSLKRNRGRRGLTILEELKKNKEVGFKLLDTGSAVKGKVDQKLVKIAKRYKGKVITVDYNLHKVGKVAGVKVLNVNELANMVKTILLPGEKVKIKIIQKGKEAKQGVGYLPDGTMVVVQGAKELVGREVEVEVERLLQTDAGRMVFAGLKS